MVVSMRMLVAPVTSKRVNGWPSTVILTALAFGRLVTLNAVAAPRLSRDAAYVPTFSVPLALSFQAWNNPIAGKSTPSTVGAVNLSIKGVCSARIQSPGRPGPASDFRVRTRSCWSGRLKSMAGCPT